MSNLATFDADVDAYLLARFDHEVATNPTMRPEFTPTATVADVGVTRRMFSVIDDHSDDCLCLNEQTNA